MEKGTGEVMFSGQIRTEADAGASFEAAIARHVRYSLAKDWRNLSRRDLFLAIALAVRDRLVDLMLETEARYQRNDAKRLYYLSLEFLMGRSLGNNLCNLGIFDLCQRTLRQMGVDLDEVREGERDAALGNGGLGRLAACFLDSLATLGMPGFGYGINYEHGLFKQEIDGGYQKEKPDNWLAEPSPWQIERRDEACYVPLYGRVVPGCDASGVYAPMWVDRHLIVGVPHDMPVVGYGGRTVNFLRLYSARASDEFDMEIFNGGDYVRAVEQKVMSESISKVLYPSDSVRAGRELRLIQEYFFVACSIRDIVRRYTSQHSGFDAFPSKVAIQLNDTHPALAVAELMRVLVDEQHLQWGVAWEITRASIAYTNHTLLPEALERWPVAMLEHVIPRHLQIIYEINRRFLDGVAAVWSGDSPRLRRMSIVEESSEKCVRMAHLAIVGSHSVNGVSALHSELIRTDLVPDFASLWPERFNNKTNGVTQRRWLLKANPRLARLVTERVGSGWVTDLERLSALEPLAEDPEFQHQFRAVKRANKERLARVILETTGVVVDPDSLFDVMAKRIHEYKRQILDVMGILHEYLRLVEDGIEPIVPRTYVFAGKAAPGYWAAKQVIKLINSVAHVINGDPRVGDWIRVVFIPDYRVSLAERLIPAADLSEQISTAGREASGTGNMKFAINGALTIGTLDGANIEIRQEVGPENIFIFGLEAEQIGAMKREGSYRPWTYYERDPRVRRVMDAFDSDRFCPEEPGLFRWIFDAILRGGDDYFHLADLGSYIDMQQRAGREYTEPAVWTRKAILNTARVGRFSSDRAAREYAEQIWHIRSCVDRGAPERGQ